MSEGSPNKTEAAPRLSKERVAETLRKEEEKRAALEPLIDTYAKLRKREVKNGKEALQLAMEIESFYRDAGMVEDAIDAALGTEVLAIQENERPLLMRVRAELARLKKESAEKCLALAKELIKSPEKFPFPGIRPEAYEQLKAESEEFPEYTTHIDVIIEKFKQLGMRVSLGRDPESGNIVMQYADENEGHILRDAMQPKHLQVTDDMDPRLKKLILLSQRRETWG